MCGIAGIIRVDPPAEDLSLRLQQMQGALRHRGPDDEGIFVSGERGAEAGGRRSVVSSQSSGGLAICGLVHTRLAILDLSAAGHQPMGISGHGARSTEHGAGGEERERYWITFNGEIYNFRELRDELETHGAVFRSNSDTEVILRLYQQHGPDCVGRLRGMFAFAIWDDREKTCFLARDPLGIKPLYYHASGGDFIFASELRALLASGLIEKKLDPEAVFGFLQSGTVPEPRTLNKGVRCLPAGSTLFWRNGTVAEHRYWNISFGSDLMADANAAESVRAALLDSVRKHFVSPETSALGLRRRRSRQGFEYGAAFCFDSIAGRSLSGSPSTPNACFAPRRAF